ncbi:UNKNOWN [Stylonychia lemnae]|uniref:Transmembrane protein n=1 Tax=Stylonychia lemnae TaxID=5949 RepID=A0A078A1F9_STYLE|nr:UNKNOWN [Stylonychia lemnae]|eukprot:CDW74614.1 UNKNOWN [Stylonychia lemnae]
MLALNLKHFYLPLLLYNFLLIAIFIYVSIKLLIRFKLNMDKSAYYTICIYIYTLAVQNYDWDRKYSELFDNYQLIDLQTIDYVNILLDQLMIFLFDTVIIYYTFEMRLVRNKHEFSTFTELDAFQSRNSLLRNILFVVSFTLLAFNQLFQFIVENQTDLEMQQSPAYILLVFTSVFRFGIDIFYISLIIKYFNFFVCQKMKMIHRRGQNLTTKFRVIVIWVYFILFAYILDLLAKLIIYAFLIRSQGLFHSFYQVYRFIFYSTLVTLHGHTFLYLFYSQAEMSENDNKLRQRAVNKKCKDTDCILNILYEDQQLDTR